MANVTLFYAQSTQKRCVHETDLLSDILSGALPAPHAIAMPCGGKGRCGKCRVKATGALSPVTAEERAALSEAELAGGVRLACCTRVLGDAAVTLLFSDALTQIRADSDKNLLPQNPLFHAYGVAVDIGTTTLAAQLYGTDGLLCTATAANPQSTYGADVISRVGLALTGKAAALADCVQSAVSALLCRLAQSAAIAPQQIDAVVITGNTAMLYLLTQRNPDCLAHAPFTADTLFGCTAAASTLHLPCAANAHIYLPRCMSAFVGADITMALLASKLCTKPQTALLADIGTNGEMALWHNGTLLCCSTAAGPAFEGAGLSMGVQGVAGAIDFVAFDGTLPLAIRTIENAPPCGICGSGIIAALAAMKQAEILDETGYLQNDADAFALTEHISVTQRDIRMVQLAKSAVCAGLRTLLDLAGVPFAEVTRLAIAGGFGSYLDLPSAAAIGLFPAALEAKAQVLGNAALTGAAMLLLDRDLVQKSFDLAAAAQTADLGTSPVFMEHYMDCMSF
ncbi:MAG: ASKHA domain-containing protein [Ruthenibacterium sp.]